MQHKWLSKKCPKCGGEVISVFDKKNYVYKLVCQKSNCTHEVWINVEEIGRLG